MEIVVTYKSHAADVFSDGSAAVVGVSTSTNEGIVVGMKISPCFPFPDGATIEDIVPIASTTGLNIKLVDEPAIEFVSYKVNLYEPTAAVAEDVNFQSGFASSVSALAAIIGDVTLVPGLMVSSAYAVADLAKDGKVNLVISLSSSAAATAGVFGIATYFGGGLSCSVASTARLSGASESLSAYFSIGSSATVNLVGMKSLNGVTLCTIVRDALNLWGIEGVCNAPDFAIARAIDDVNSAMQTVWNQADERDYWTSETLTLTFADGASSQDLPTDIQNVVGPCRRADNKRPLATIGTIGELETFADIYLDGETADEPLAYHIDRTKQAGDDPVKAVLRITPAVSGTSVSFLLDVVREAPRYYVADLLSCPILPIPHRYAESLFLPIVRYKASSFWLFNNPESKASIDRDYQMAMNAIGMADPNPGKTLEKEGSPTK